MDNIDSCKLCFQIFEDRVRPRCLPCGHSFCTSCINSIIEDGKLVCPKCKQIHRAVNGNEFPINYDLEEMISTTKDTASQEETGVRSNKMQVLIEEHNTNITSLVTQSEALEAEIKEYDDFLQDRKVKHEEILQKIKALGARNESVMSELDEEHEKLVCTLKEVCVLRERVKNGLLMLDKDANTKCVVAAMSELDKSVAALEVWNETSRSQLPNAEVISSSLKVLVESSSAMSTVDLSDQESSVHDFSQTDFSVLEKLNKISGNGTLNFQKLRTPSEPLKKLLEDEKVYAIQTDQGNFRSAKLSITKEGICLHYLQEGDLPSHVHTIKHSEVIENLDKDSTVVFMDLAWGGVLQGRVHILLHPDTPLARQFRILCTAELGQSYAHSYFYTVGSRGAVSEHLAGGDYQQNNGNGGASVIKLQTDDSSCYIRQFREGIVCATQGATDGPRSAQFNIVTGSGNVLQNYNNVFGKVQEGMAVLKAAAAAPVGQVEVRDCGVILPIQL